VGDPNPEVRLGVMSATGGAVRWMELTSEKDMYIPRFGWAGDGLIWAMVLNRAQDQLDLYLADTGTGKSRRILSEKSDTWVEVDDNFRMLPGGRFLWPSWRDGHTHLYLYSFDKNQPLVSDARLERQITRGDFEVLSVEAVDEASGTLFLTTTVNDVRQRHLCSVKLDGSNFQVLTGSRPGTHRAQMDSGGKYFVDRFSALMTPPEVSLCRVGGKCENFWRSNSIEPYHLTAPQFVDFKAEDGTVLHGLLLMPPVAPGKKAPVLLNPYGGPQGQVVTDAWAGDSLLFDEILMRDGIAVLKVDNRGMGNRGKNFAAAMMHNFGEVELRDQLAALDQALARFPQLDGNRVGIWGWSYGGFMTLYAMTHSERFKTGVAVAPVTDYLNYDTIYTERYGGLLPENAAAYRRSAPVNSAANLHGHLLEVHGTSDDNVHMQNTIQMVNALINAGKKFELMLYPRKTHGIGGSQARIDLFTRIREHLDRDLLGAETAKTE
jgi:dipeptidyl-peptidase-4